MKRDMDLIRELLLKLESLPFDQEHPAALHAHEERVAVDGHSTTEIAYHLRLLKDAGLIGPPTKSQLGTAIWFDGLTWAGHDYLDAIRDPEVWRKTKEGASAAGGFTVDLLKKLAEGLIPAVPAVEDGQCWHDRPEGKDSRRRGAGDLDPEDGDCGVPAFSGANAVWIVCAGCRRGRIW
jgi:hypothetical protein